MHPLTSDYVGELALLEASRLQRAALELPELPEDPTPFPEEDND